MTHLDAVERWIWQITSRTLDQHASDPVPAAARLPACADELRDARGYLMTVVDALRSALINADDLSGPAEAVTGSVGDAAAGASNYLIARTRIGRLVDDPDRVAYAAANPARPVRQQYVSAGDSVEMVLPHTDVCRDHATRRAIRTRAYRRLSRRVHARRASRCHPPSPRLAVINRDPVEDRLNILRAADAFN